jgi:hypothetical protein
MLRGEVSLTDPDPVTSSTSRVFPFQTLLPAGSSVRRVDSQAQAEPVIRLQLQL